MRNLLKASVLTWIGTAAIILAAVLRGKALAVAVGPVGVGTISQLVNFSNLLRFIGTLSLGSGIAQYIAKFRGEQAGDDIRRIVQTNLVVVGAFGILLTAGLWGLAPTISRWLFNGDSSFAILVRLMSLALVAVSLESNLQSVLNGYGAADLSSLVNIVTAIATVGSTLILVPMWGITGAVAALTLTYFVRLVTQLILLRLKYPETLLGMPYFVDHRAFHEIFAILIRIAFASMIMGGSDILVQLFVRTRIIELYGLETNGLYQAAFGATTQIITNGVGFISVYATAQVNSATNRQERTDQINQAFQLALLVVILGITGLILFRNLYIHLLLSPEFLPSSKYFTLQAVGEGLKQLALVIGMGMLLSAGVRKWMAAGMLWAGANAIFAFIILPLGAWTAPLPYLGSAVIYLVYCWFTVSRSDGFALSNHNKSNLVWAIILVAFLSTLPLHPIFITLGLAAFVLWAWVALGKYQKIVLDYHIKNFLRLVKRA